MAWLGWHNRGPPLLIDATPAATSASTPRRRWGWDIHRARHRHRTACGARPPLWPELAAWETSTGLRGRAKRTGQVWPKGRWT